MRSTSLLVVRLFLAILAVATTAFAQRGTRYAVLLEDPPLARQVANVALRPEAVRPMLASANAEAPRRVILAKQEALRSALAERNIAVTGSIHTLLNAIFIIATPEQVAELK